MNADPSGPIMEALNEFLAGRPEFAALFRQARTPSFRYWRIEKAVSGGRWDRWYAWTTERTRGPKGGPVGFYAVECVDRGKVVEVARAVRFARRSMAKARAYRWYAGAKGLPEEKRVYVPVRRPKFEPTGHPATGLLPTSGGPRTKCPRCGTEGVGLSWKMADGLWLCDPCRTKPAEVAPPAAPTDRESRPPDPEDLLP